jgi:CoA:oxalate CoA-transferase
LTGLLEAALAAKGAKEWESIFTALGIPAGCVATVPEALRSEQVATRELLQTFASEQSGVGRPITVAKTGFKMSNGDPEPASPPPLLGAHTLEVLSGLGYTQSEIDQLQQQGAI